jgi:hypothetical protein
MQYAKQMLGVACTALLMWGVEILCDILDEYVLDTSDGLAAAAFFIAPVALFVWYIVHCIKSKPEGKNLLIWHISYAIVFLLVWLYMYPAVNNGYYFIDQAKRGNFMDLNGIELMWYGFPALFAFLILCILFHSIRWIIRICKKHKTRRTHHTQRHNY